MRKKERRSVEQATQKTVELACEADVPIVWDRLAAQEPQCGFGRLGICCRNCTMAAPDGPTAGKIQRPLDGKDIESVAFAQCAGSRDENHLKHCSGVCCRASLKQARYVREQYPDAQIYIFYIHIRAPGRLEDFSATMQKDEKLRLIKGQVAKITENPASRDLEVEAEDSRLGTRVKHKVSLVVLATGMLPVVPNVQVGADGGLRKDEHGFLTAEQSSRGLLAAGCVKRPVDVAACVRDATGAALKALQCCVESVE